MNDSVEERKKNRIKKVIDAALNANPITGISTKAARLLVGALTPEKEDALESIISDLKSEEKLSKGDRGAAEAIPKKEFDKSVFMSKFKKAIRNAKPAKMPEIRNNPRDDYPQFLAKGGSVKKNKSNMITKRGWGASRKT